MNLKNFEKTEKNTAVLTVASDPAEFEKAVNGAYLKNRKDIYIPGFRKGKAPRQVIEGMYGSGVFYEDAFELCWAIFSGLAHISGNIRGRHDLKPEESDLDRCYFSKLITDGGIACARIAPGFRTFFLMPEPKGSLRDKLADIESLQKLFEAFADADLLKILFNLYTRPNTPVDATFVSKQTGIPLKRVEAIMDVLCRNQLLFRSFGTTARGDIAFYLFNQESAVIPLLCFADEIQTTDMRDLVVDFSRTKPLF